MVALQDRWTSARNSRPEPSAALPGSNFIHGPRQDSVVHGLEVGGPPWQFNWGQIASLLFADGHVRPGAAGDVASGANPLAARHRTRLNLLYTKVAVRARAFSAKASTFLPGKRPSPPTARPPSPAPCARQGSSSHTAILRRRTPHPVGEAAQRRRDAEVHFRSERATSSGNQAFCRGLLGGSFAASDSPSDELRLLPQPTPLRFRPLTSASGRPGTDGFPPPQD